MGFSDFIFPSDRSRDLSDFKSKHNNHYKNKKEAAKYLTEGILKLRDLQDKLYAESEHALLLIFQAMDAAGKDSTIKHVMSGVNPQGCQVKAFKAPSDEELDHDYLWRCMKELPERGKIGIFNRSYYEEVLVARIHSDILIHKQKIPGINKRSDLDQSFWENRYEDIRNFEKYLERNGIIVLKFFLNISKEEQKERFLKRIDRPDKNWKISLADFKERQYWDEYMLAYQKMLQNTSTEYAPWHVIPADNKLFMRALVCDIIVDHLKAFNLKYPVVNEAKMSEIEKAKQLLLNEE
jgi:PPK2 family polyphosphate:nucleotide phosphotransferase